MPLGIPKTEYERMVTHGGTPPPRQYLNRSVGTRSAVGTIVSQDDALMAIGIVVGFGAAFLAAEYLWQRMQ